jgi:hypothetical protein
MLNSHAAVQSFMKDVMEQLGADAEFAPHGEFWETLPYNEFINGNVPGIGGSPVKILVMGSSAQSPLIHALKGEGIFGPGGRFGRMPSGGPFFRDEQIKELADWIDANCPENAPATSRQG